MKVKDWLVATFPLNRVVALLTPPVAALAGLVRARLALQQLAMADRVAFSAAVRT